MLVHSVRRAIAASGRAVGLRHMGGRTFGASSCGRGCSACAASLCGYRVRSRRARPAGQDRGARRFADRRLRSRRAGGFSGEARAGAEGQRHSTRDRQRGRLRRHGDRRPGAARLVGAGGHRCRDPRTRRQRHAARHRPGGHAQRRSIEILRGSSERRIACCSAACGRRPTWAPTTRRIRRASLPNSPPPTARCSIRSSWTASRPNALNQPDGIHPTAAGVDVIVANILPEGRRTVAQVARRKRSR